MTFVLSTETIKKDVIKNSMLTEHNKTFFIIKKKNSMSSENGLQ